MARAFPKPHEDQMKIGILQAGHAPDVMISKTGDYGELFQQFLAGEGFDFTVYSVVDMEFPASAEVAEGWLITGSRHGAYEAHDFIPPLETLIRDSHARRLPLAGICFGHQIIAQALGGKVEKYDGGWSVGHTEYTFEGQTTTLNAWHQDQVTLPPADAVATGSSPFCKFAFLEYRDHIFSVQAHPEFNSDFVEGLIDFRGKGVVPDPLLKEARSKLPLSNDSDRIRQKIVTLFQSAMVNV